MPYIKQEDRKKYEDINAIVSKLVVLSEKDENEVYGNMNYIFFTIIKRYLAFKGLRYFRLQNIIGTIKCVENEIINRILNFYENSAMSQNGDIEPINLFKKE
jgi:hypothetical protein